MSLQGDIVKKEPKMKRAMHNERKKEVDRISTLSDCILMHIMEFFTSKEAVQTCILSKRWKDLWKYLPTVIANSDHFQNAECFQKFVRKVLQHRDDSSALRNVVVDHLGHVPSQIWSKIINYVASHEVEQFKVVTCLLDDFKSFHLMLSLHSLKSLDLSLFNSREIIKLLETLDLPELVNFRLKYFAFTSSDDNSCAMPFIGCKKLSTLVIDRCTLIDAKMLCVTGDKLANLTIQYGMFIYNSFKVQISSPNLKTLAFAGYIRHSDNHQILDHNLDFIEGASINVLCNSSYPEVVETLKNLLKRIRSVHSLTLCFQTFQGLSLFPNFPNIESIGFRNLKSLTLIYGYETPLP